MHFPNHLPGVILGTAIAVVCLAALGWAQQGPPRGPAPPAELPNAVVGLDERITGAAHIVVATARTVSPRWAENEYGDRLIVSRILLEVRETLKGAPGATPQLDLEGGTLDGITLSVASLPTIVPGERGVFFLDAGQAGVHRPFMDGMGILKLDDKDRVHGTTVPLGAIRARARALGRQGASR